jgi:hypothetical protein
VALMVQREQQQHRKGKGRQYCHLRAPGSGASCLVLAALTPYPIPSLFYLIFPTSNQESSVAPYCSGESSRGSYQPSVFPDLSFMICSLFPRWLSLCGQVCAPALADSSWEQAEAPHFSSPARDMVCAQVDTACPPSSGVTLPRDPTGKP